MSEKIPIWIELAQEFLRASSLTVAYQTQLAYEFDLRKFTAFLQDRKVKSVKRLTVRLVRDHLYGLKQEGLSDTTIRRHYNTIKQFCNYLRSTGLLDTNVFQDIKRPRTVSFTVKVPTTKDMEKLLDLPDTETESGCRDKAVLELLYSSGLRVSEVVNLTLGDIKPGSVQINQGKGSKTRTIPLTTTAWLWVGEYLEYWRSKLCDRDWLFLTNENKQMNRETITRMITRYGKQLGLDISAHTLRHACATHLLEAGVDIRYLQTLLGHSNIAVTAKYATVTSVSLGSIFNLKHPREQ
jgi:site-specific recombinase XerD